MGKRPPALKVLQQTPTDPSEAGPDNRLCQKCGLWVEPEKKEWEELTIKQMWKEYMKKTPDIVFLGSFEQKDKDYLLTITRKMEIPDESIVFRGETICPTTVEDRHQRQYPTQLRCCRAFLLGWLGASRPAVVMAMGDSGLAALTGNASMRVTHQFGREITIPEIPEQVAFATYHPSDARQWKKAARSIQNNFQIVRDVKRVKQEVLKKPKEVAGVYDELVGFDSEFDKDKVWTISIADDSKYVVKDIENDIIQDSIDSNLTLAAHYIQVDLDTLVRIGSATEDWLKGRRIYDTFVLAHMQNENLPMKYHYGVEDCLTRFYRAPNWKAETEVKDPADPGSWGLERRKKRCGYDAWASLQILNAPQIQQVVLGQPFVVEWQHRMIPTYHRMKYAGVSIDRGVFDELNRTTHLEEVMYREQVEPVIRKKYDWELFEITNNAHIRSLLYDKMKMPKWKFSESGLPSVDADAMEDMIAEPLVPELLKWRKANKLMTTWYGKDANAKSIPLYQRINWGSRGIGHLSVNLGVGQTTTLRRQSNAPNMQNWAKETRPIVCSRFGSHGKLVWSDYEKLEVFLLADEIKDEKLKQYFTSKGGYLGLAKDLLKIDIDKSSPNYRAVKATALGANYNMKAMTLATQLYYKAGVRYCEEFPERKWNSNHYLQSRELLDKYHRMFPKIGAWHERVKVELTRKQGVHNRFGQFRHLPCPNGESTPGFARSLNQAINFKIQSVAGLVTGIAAVLLEENFLRNTTYAEYHKYLYNKFRAIEKGSDNPWVKMTYLCNEVHDELMADTPKENVAYTKETMERVMVECVKKILQTADPTFDAHLGVEIQSGSHWCKEEV